jgi:hypothetical protein
MLWHSSTYAELVEEDQDHPPESRHAQAKADEEPRQ